MKKSRNNLGFSCVIALIVSVVSTSMVKADLVYSDSISTTGGTFNSSFTVDNLADEGLTAATDTILTSVAFSDALSYATPNTPTYPVILTFEFASATDIEAFHLWNNVVNNQFATSGIAGFDLTFYDDAAGAGNTIGSVFSGTAISSVLSGSFAAQTFDVGARSGVRSVTLTINGNTGANTAFVGAREIAFEEVSVLDTELVYADSAATTGGEFDSRFTVNNLSDEGLTAATDTISTTVAFADELSYASKSGPTGGYPVTITFDFTTATDIEALHLWNNVVQGGEEQKGIRDFTLTFYDGAGATGNTIGSVFADTATVAPTSGSFAAETFTVGSRPGVRSAALTIASNIGQTAVFISAREIAFEAVVVAPDPDSTVFGRVFADHMVLQRNEPVKIFGTDSMNLGSQAISVNFDGQTKNTTTDAEGNWEVTLDAMTANAVGQSLVVTGSSVNTISDVLIGEVWLAAGQSNMNWRVNQSSNAPHATTYPLIRMCNWEGTVDTDSTRAFGSAEFALLTQDDYYSGNWEVMDSSSVQAQSAVAYFFAHNLAQDLSVPIGIVELAFGGTTTEAFISPAAHANNPHMDDTFKRPHLTRTIGSYAGPRIYKEVYDNDVNGGNYTHTDVAKPHPHPFAPGFLYYSGISHLKDFTFKGAIWYQGESNTVLVSGKYQTNGNRLADHQTLVMKTLIADWRSTFNKPDFPFYMVQLPRINGGLQVLWPYYREAQSRVAADIEGCELATIIELGDNGSNIHPVNKEPVGERLAAIARAKLYGDDITYSGPVFSHHTVTGDKIILHFDHTDGGLTDSDGGALKSFEISGIDRNFVAATATIIGNTVEVTAASLSNPVAVRHAWEMNPDVDLFNGNGFSSSSFRTDKWIAAPGRKLRVACIGDSITFGYTLSNRTVNNYPAQLANILGTTNFEVQNFGISGYGFIRPGRQYKNTAEYANALAWQPDVVICNLGINDLPDWGSYTQDQFETEYFNVVDAFVQSGNDPLFIQWHKLAPLYPGHTQGNDADVPLLNEWIQKAASNTNAVMFDMEAPLLGHADWFPDNVHPNPTGAREIAETTFCLIDQLGDLDGKPYISEILSINTNGLQDEDNHFSDWIELSNNGTSGVCLSDHYLTNDLGNLTQWQVPTSTVIEPGDNLIIHASAKDRAVNQAELHTNFTLPDTGGSLGLIDTDGSTVIDSLIDYPAQHADVSYGRTTSVSATVGSGSALTYHVPTDGTLGASWTTTAFDDSSWTAGTSGLGFDKGLISFDGSQIWDSSFQNEWFEENGGGSVKSLNGNNLRYDHTGQTSATQLGGGDSTYSGGLSSWDTINAGDWTFEINLKVHDSPNGFSLWLGTDTDRIVVEIYNDSTQGYRSGSFNVDQTAAPNNDGSFHTFTVTHDSVADRYHAWRDGILLTPAGGEIYDNSTDDSRMRIGDYTSGIFGDGFDVEIASISYTGTLYEGLIQTDVGAPMHDVNSSAYIRMPFTLSENPASITALDLGMQYEDGFVAYLNGTEVARRNAPASQVWNSTSTSERVDTDALTTETIDLAAHIGELSLGANVLAFHAMNSSSSADRFLVRPVLTPSAPVQTLFFQTPTPDTDNGGSSVGSLPLATWKSVYGIASDSSDDDGDGLNALMEFLTGSSPINSASADRPIASLTEVAGEDYLSVSFRVAQGLSSLSYTLEHSDDLITAPIWETDNSPVMITSVDNGDGSSTLTYRLSSAMGADVRRFLRVNYSYSE